jgi:hypothetical protein
MLQNWIAMPGEFLTKKILPRCEKHQAALMEGNNDFYSFNPISQFWASEVIESNAFIGFENLQKTAISLLSAPAGNGGVEATGSVIKRVVNPQTNRMSDEHIEMWIVVRSYIKSKKFNFQQMITEVEKQVKALKEQ